LRYIDRSTNYRNEAMVLGFSDLARLVHERPLVLVKSSGVMVYDEHGRDYIEAVSSFYCPSLRFSDEELIEAANAQMRALPMYPWAAPPHGPSRDGTGGSLGCAGAAEEI
jgi:4-aminobutyrate--pyruvate transaminase